MIRSVPFFYGWVILAVGFIAAVLVGPSQSFTISLYIETFTQEFETSRSTISLLYGVATLLASLCLPYTGRLVDRYGARMLLVISTIGLGFACAGMALVTNLTLLFIGLVALRFLGFGATVLLANNVIAQWFIRRRGFVMGIAGLSLAVSLALFPLIGEFLIDWVGWRGSWLAMAALVWLILPVLMWAFVRNRPEQYGLLPDGDSNGADLQMGDPLTAAPGRLGPIAEENWTLAEARQTGAFWIFAAALSAMTMVMAGLVFHQVSVFEVRGLDRSHAVAAFNAMAICTIIGNLTMGQLIDRFSARRLLLFSLFMLALAMWLAQVMTLPIHGYILSGLIGLVSGFFRVIDSTVWAKYYGRRHLGSIRGVTMIGTNGGTAIGPYVLGMSVDLFGSYGPGLLGLLVLPVGIGMATFFVNRPEKQMGKSSSS